MAYKYKKIKCNSSNYYPIKRDKTNIKNIVIHFTGNAKGDTAIANGNYFARGDRNASAHDFVDDKEVVNSVPYNYIAWHCGGGLQDQGSPYKNEGAKKHGKVTNTNSIGVEMCDCIKDTKNNLSADTRANAATHISKLLKKFKICPDNIYRHFDVTGKLCPIYFVTNESDWNDFKVEIWLKYLKFNKKIDVESGKFLIKKLQSRLNEICIPNRKKLVVDGNYGNNTRYYVLAYWKMIGWNNGTKYDGWTDGYKTLKKLKLL